jgi:hypothetical protein
LGNRLARRINKRERVKTTGDLRKLRSKVLYWIYSSAEWWDVELKRMDVFD